MKIHKSHLNAVSDKKCFASHSMDVLQRVHSILRRIQTLLNFAENSKIPDYYSQSLGIYLVGVSRIKAFCAPLAAVINISNGLNGNLDKNLLSRILWHKNVQKNWLKLECRLSLSLWAVELNHQSLLDGCRLIFRPWTSFSMSEFNEFSKYSPNQCQESYDRHLFGAHCDNARAYFREFT